MEGGGLLKPSIVLKILCWNLCNHSSNSTNSLTAPHGEWINRFLLLARLLFVHHAPVSERATALLKLILLVTWKINLFFCQLQLYDSGVAFLDNASRQSMVILIIDWLLNIRMRSYTDSGHGACAGAYRRVVVQKVLLPCIAWCSKLRTLLWGRSLATSCVPFECYVNLFFQFSRPLRPFFEASLYTVLNLCLWLLLGGPRRRRSNFSSWFGWVGHRKDQGLSHKVLQQV